MVNPPERTTAAAFPRYSNGEVLADSASLQLPRLFVRRARFPRAVDRFLVPSAPEPLMSCVLAGLAEFRERDIGQLWVRRQLKRGDIFVTRSKVPYELRWRSPTGEELDDINIHLALDQFLAALEEVCPGSERGAKPAQERNGIFEGKGAVYAGFDISGQRDRPLFCR